MKNLLAILSFILLASHKVADTPVILKWKVTDLESYIAKADHPLIINFWATFCVPCNKEIPYFQSTVEKYKQQGVELVLVSLDLPDYYPARIASFAGKNGYQATIAWLDETDADYFCPRVDKRWSGGIPSSLFINNKTHFRRFYDRQLTEPQVSLAIKEMIAPSL
ncbi:TlpA disulfide reductase family protein [Flavitalea sp. BT771]|uniref:TlpA disulfide reductase family protein n=1 Tax=Flavitalea sp. BT771 TaxID=3063329 RepID=UPI0026E4321B|nr:TlpA disulfide reductase family protein [Flavitalea sp. BT771]MDO6431597.1 TlpA disulfide reductase family protein [Flavitalea sp. BT771]MDV6220505.1 TlpA disulfide reductase family protein [Flavitalea sp. BT771]